MTNMLHIKECTFDLKTFAFILTGNYFFMIKTIETLPFCLTSAYFCVTVISLRI